MYKRGFSLGFAWANVRNLLHHFAFRFYHPIFVTEDVNALINLKNVRQENCAKLKMIVD